MTSQEAPFAIQLSPCQGCNLGCNFCGIHSIGYGKKQNGVDLMPVEVAASVAQQIKDLGWNPRVEFAMHGEPTLHPDLPALIEPFGKFYTLVTTNGGGLLMDTRRKVQELFGAGLNTLALDDYQTNRMVERFCENIGEDIGASPFQVFYYPKDRSASPHTRYNGKRIVIIQDLTEATAGTHSDVHNSAGDAGPLDRSMNTARCAKPFRELAIRWDGNVAMCCNDWTGTFKVGNVLTDGIEAIWHSDGMVAARKALYNRRRDLVPVCDGCTAKSYRVGLLPDKKGAIDLPMPTYDDFQAIEEACAGEPYSPRVRPRGSKIN